MRFAARISGTFLCICGIVAAQQSPPASIVNREKAIPVSRICMPYGVRVFGFWKSRQRPEITVDAGDTPPAEVSVEVYRGADPNGERPNAKPILVLTPDASGHVVLPRLALGKYYVLGRSKPDREDYLYLEISAVRRKRPDLVLHLHPARGSAEWVLDRLGTMTEENQVSAFRGIVEAFGKPVPDAEIDVFVRKLGTNQQPIRLRADGRGEFSANLPDGEYAVDIRKGQSMFWVDVSPRGPSAGLQVRLCPIVTQ